jgi:hypothetical protein
MSIPSVEPFLYRVLTRIKADIAAISAGSTYWNTLTGTDAVKIGATKDPQVFPAVRIAVGSMKSDYSQGPPMTTYRRTFPVTVWIWAQKTSGDEDTRTRDLLRLAADVQIALESDRTLGGLSTDLQVEQMTEYITPDVAPLSMPLLVTISARTNQGAV